MYLAIKWRYAHNLFHLVDGKKKFLKYIGECVTVPPEMSPVTYCYLGFSEVLEMKATEGCGPGWEWRGTAAQDV